MMSQLKKLLVPTDFSEHSEASVDYACNLAVGSNTVPSQVHLIHVISDTPGGNGQAEKLCSRLEQLGTAVDAKAELELETVKKVIPGEPSRVITDYARDHGIDLIVMGTHGRTGLSHFALGSVAERVIRSSVCPVLVMGPRDKEREVTLVRAAEEVSNQLGDAFDATYEDGVARIRSALQDMFDLHSASCFRLVDHLQENDWVEWKAGDPGTWMVMEGLEFIEEAPARLTDKPESQAIDLIERARRLRATDIHLDPGNSNEVVVRLRIDGKLEEYCRLNELVGEHLVNQLKMLANLDIADPFRPQEGRVRLPDAIPDLEIRITTARVAAGDAIALRLFDGKNIFLPLTKLGFSEPALESVNQMLRLGEGLVLVTGPTGAGKTTTVYSMLETLGGVESNIVSVEDPVEFAVPFVRQMNVDGKHDITMTSGLRTILRMDPDVVFVGEIRDSEAARTAMQAASSGKYVLSTLHTRDVASTITALIDMGIGDRSAAGNLTGIINQRLLRRLCANCKKPVALTDEQQKHFATAGVDSPVEVFVPRGCGMCRDTGFRGRVGVFEVAMIDEKLSNAIAGGDSENHLRDLVRSKGVISLTTDALTKAAAGITNVDEATAVHWLS